MSDGESVSVPPEQAGTKSCEWSAQGIIDVLALQGYP
jgi:hypothetical protein